MKTPLILAAALAVAMPAMARADDGAVDGSASAIRSVISGKTCVGTDILTFGKIIDGSAGTFERQGKPKGLYQLGYGTILIRRGEDLHGHVTSVSVRHDALYMSTGTYRCAPYSSARAD